MNVLIFSRSSALYSTRRLVLVCRARGHEVTVVDPLRCSIMLGGASSEATLATRHGPLGPFDAVVPRIGRSITFHGLAVLRQLEMQGIYACNGASAIADARDKMRALQLLSAAKVPIVPTAVARQASEVRRVIEALGGPPVVIKITDGSQGLGVMLAESLSSAESIVDAFHLVEQDILIQPFLPGADSRLIVVGDRVVAAMRRQARPGEFRSNIHRGGAAHALHPSEKERRVALAAAAALQLEVAGVDVIEAPDGPLVLEVNASPGMRGVESASGRNVAGALIAHVETRAARSRPDELIQLR